MLHDEMINMFILLIPPDLKCIYEWKFKAKNYADNQAIGIHTFSDHEKIVEDDFSEKEPHADENSYYWALAVTGYKCSNRTVIQNNPFIQFGWEEGDTIRMILDTEMMTLSYGVNDDNVKVIFEDITLCKDTYMAITMGLKDLSIELLSFLSTNKQV